MAECRVGGDNLKILVAATVAVAVVAVVVVVVVTSGQAASAAHSAWQLSCAQLWPAVPSCQLTVSVIGGRRHLLARQLQHICITPHHGTFTSHTDNPLKGHIRVI